MTPWLTRRELLERSLSASVAAPLVSALATDGSPEPAFAHGVASGDPTPTGVVLWTRVSGAEGDVRLRWWVAGDAALTEVVTSGEVVARADDDHTVHVDVGGLDAATSYSYAFDTPDGTRSPVGRTRTSRAADDDGEVRAGVVSCSSFAAGPFTAYRRLAEVDVDLVVHLGDYLYDVGGGPRRHQPAEAPVTLQDYRRRHAQQRSDADLQLLHATHPMAAVWDDHEVAGNAWRHGADGHDPDEQGPWEERRAAALRAWTEWLPVRRPDPARPERIWRRLPLGGVADLVLLDTRHDGRDEQVSPDDPDAAATLVDPDRRLISDEQRTWLADVLATSTAAWRVLANQVVLTPLAFEVPAVLGSSTAALGLTVDDAVLNPDAWDGYPAERRRLLDLVAAAGPTVVVTGDVHSSWAFDVRRDDGEPVTVEWVTPSVSAPPFADVVGLPDAALAPRVVDLISDQLPDVRWAELTRHGFMVVALRAEDARCDWWHVELEDGSAEVAASRRVLPGGATQVEGSSLDPRPPAPTTLPPPPPPTPTTTVAAAGEGGGASDDPATVGVAAAGVAAAGVAAVAGLVALRRRRGKPD